MYNRSFPLAGKVDIALGSRRHALKRLLAGAGLAGGVGCSMSDSSQDRPRTDNAAPVQPLAIRSAGYRLVQNWDFGTNITNDKALKDAFFTRYIYDDGKLDTLNDEWQRYRDNDNHVFEDAALALVARAPAAVASGQIESA
jgi:hypothetical protein